MRPINKIVFLAVALVAPLATKTNAQLVSVPVPAGEYDLSFSANRVGSVAGTGATLTADLGSASEGGLTLGSTDAIEKLSTVIDVTSPSTLDLVATGGTVGKTFSLDSFILTPVPEPTTIGLFCIGALSLIGVMKIRHTRV